MVALALAWLLGAIAHRLRISPLVGYLLAGIAIGPFTPGFVADQSLANELAEIGGAVAPVLATAKRPLLVIENDSDAVTKLKAQGIEAIAGNAADPEMIAAANLTAARCLLVAVPDAFEGGQIVEQARRINPQLRILTRSHSQAESEHLMRHGATLVIMGEHEIAKAMLADIEDQPGLAFA